MPCLELCAQSSRAVVPHAAHADGPHEEQKLAAAITVGVIWSLAHGAFGSVVEESPTEGGLKSPVVPCQKSSTSESESLAEYQLEEQELQIRCTFIHFSSVDASVQRDRRWRSSPGICHRRTEDGAQQIAEIADDHTGFTLGSNMIQFSEWTVPLTLSQHAVGRADVSDMSRDFRAGVSSSRLEAMRSKGQAVLASLCASRLRSTPGVWNGEVPGNPGMWTSILCPKVIPSGHALDPAAHFQARFALSQHFSGGLWWPQL